MFDATKISLKQMQSFGIWDKVEQPRTVYHMTDRSNLESITKDGAIKTGHDYVCWFFPDINSMFTFFDVTGALVHGRDYFDYDGKTHHAPPLDPAQTIVLKLTPRYPEPQLWYKQRPKHEQAPIIGAAGIPLTGAEREIVFDKQRKFENCRICHYGAMKFKRSFEVLELSEIINSMEKGERP